MDGLLLRRASEVCKRINGEIWLRQRPNMEKKFLVEWGRLFDHITFHSNLEFMNQLTEAIQVWNESVTFHERFVTDDSESFLRSWAFKDDFFVTSCVPTKSNDLYREQEKRWSLCGQQLLSSTHTFGMVRIFLYLRALFPVILHCAKHRVSRWDLGPT